MKGTIIKSLAVPTAIMSLLCASCSEQCHNETTRKRNYLKQTLPYHTAVLASIASSARRTGSDKAVIAGLENLLIEHIVRLHLLLRDPAIHESEKAYGFAALDRALDYVRSYDAAKSYKKGMDYTLLDEDFMLPDKIKIRDILDTALGEANTDSQPPHEP